MHRALICLLLAWAVCTWPSGPLRANDQPPPRANVSFNRDVRPILSDKCFQCHGPDAAARKADLRLDDSQSATADREGRRVVVPGDLEASEFYRRITAEDPAERMPPVAARRPLEPLELALLKRWIEAGARYEPHWAFVVPARAAIPAVGRPGWPRNAIDAFVLARLEELGLEPAPEADRATLIRRVSLDLTGLPPTPEQVDAFVADPSAAAYEQLVERLLDSPRLGERLSADWLDAARYADTHGYLFDTERSMWRWREWVIDAFNANMPYDQFTIEQLAGDLLPGATLDQKIASGFNRNHIINNEAGAIAEEYYVENIVDRVNTTATVWMGLSLACAQCHDHKYDPFTQREYYQLYAFFNNVPELGLDGLNSNAQPVVAAPSLEQQRRLDAFAQALQAAGAELQPLEPALAPALAEWEQRFRRPEEPLGCGLLLHLPCEGQLDGMGYAASQATFIDGPAAFEAGLLGQAAAFDGKRFIELPMAAAVDLHWPFTFSAWVYPADTKGRRGLFSKMEPAERRFRGVSLQLVDGKVALFLVREYPENMLQVETKSPLEPNRWHHVAATYDGSGKAAGARIFIDGRPAEIGLSVDKLSGSIACSQPLWIGNAHPGAKFAGRIDEARVDDRALSAEEIAALPGLSIQSLLAVEPALRNDEQRQRIRKYFLDHAAPESWRAAQQKIARLQQERDLFQKELPTVMVMQERPQPQETRLLVRGAYNRPGETVAAATPSALPPMPDHLPRNRLGLALWLTSGNHPLTARVAVNRYWQLVFGAGLVRTTENFGAQGEPPTHPELLDWLAEEFVASGWNVKHLLRQMVTSATYRQSSRGSPQGWRVDPQNRWLARGSRFRLPAESVRDAALYLGGLLVEQRGGPSVKPYMPAELWKEVAFDVTGNVLTAQIYEQQHGAALYRRSLYTFWKRTAPPPAMLLFDAPDRERCTVRREPTNTPLQALVVLNETAFVEAARHLAERMMRAGDQAASRLAYGFKAATGREPRPAELDLLMGLLRDQVNRFQFDLGAALAFVSIGESPQDQSLPLTELAAYAVVANALLNLDETLTRH